MAKRCAVLTLLLRRESLYPAELSGLNRRLRLPMPLLPLCMESSGSWDTAPAMPPAESEFLRAFREGFEQEALKAAGLRE